MGQNWHDCIVAYMDLIGVKHEADPSKLMRRLHNLVVKETPQLARISHAYTWNDAVLILAFVGSPDRYSAAMREAEALKRQIDSQIGRSFAIAVKGQAFPPIGPTRVSNKSSQVTVIEASSWAMANCFAIERESRKRHWQKPWYVDIRITRKIQTNQSFEEKEVVMLGAKGGPVRRKIRAFSGYLWP